MCLLFALLRYGYFTLHVDLHLGQSSINEGIDTAPRCDDMKLPVCQIEDHSVCAVPTDHHNIELESSVDKAADEHTIMACFSEQ